MLNSFPSKQSNSNSNQMAPVMDADIPTTIRAGGADDNASHASSRGSSRGSRGGTTDADERAPLTAPGPAPGHGFPGNAPPRGAIENARRFLWDEDEAAEAAAGGMGLSPAVSSDNGTAPLTTRNIDWSSGSAAAQQSTSMPSGLGTTGPDATSLEAASSVGSLFGSKQLVPPSSSERPFGLSAGGGMVTAEVDSYYSGADRSAMPGYSQGASGDSLYPAGVRFPRPHERDNSGGAGSSLKASLINIGSGLQKGAGALGQSLMGGKNKNRGMGSGSMVEVNFHNSQNMNMAPHGSKDGLDFVDDVERSHRDRGRGGSGGLHRIGRSASGCLAGCGTFVKRRKVGVLVACLAALVIGTVVVFTSKDGSATGTVSSSSTVEGAGSDEGGATPPPPKQKHVEDPARFQAVRTRIVESGVTADVAALDRPGTPQYQALKWISDWDGAKLDPAADDTFLVQRYALAVFFFSTYVAAEVMDETGAEQYYEPNVVPGKGWKDSTHWMTGRGYCSWAGVRCHHKKGSADLTETSYDGNDGVTHLNLTANNVRGSLPPEMAAFVDLRVLDLGQNGLTGSIPEEMGELTRLVTLYLGDNDLSGEIPTTLGNLASVTHLYLDRNLLEGSIPPEIGNMASMHMMGLYENYLTGTLPDLTKMVDLRALYLDDNDLTGPIPSTIGNLVSLEDLRLGTNNFTGTIPPEMSQLEVLSTAYLEYNALTGPIPWQFYNLKELDEIHLYENYLSGTLPYQLGELRDLEILYLDNNEFTGPIPATIGDCDDLTELFLHNNGLTGSIPAQITRLKDLTHLRVDSNDLTGELPEHLDRLFKLERMYLNDNKFSGALPETLGTMKYLQVARLHDNNFTGQVPDGVCSLRTTNDGILRELKADCGGPDPDVVCECCTECFE